MRKRSAPKQPGVLGSKASRDAEKLLNAAAALIAERSRFTVGAFARDRHGNRMRLERVNDPKAVRWSPMGALLHAAYQGWGTETEVIYVAPGEPWTLTGPAYVLEAIRLFESEIVAVYRSAHESARVPRAEALKNPLYVSLLRATPPARQFWVSVLIVALPETSRRASVDAFEAAAERARTERADRQQNARSR